MTEEYDNINKLNADAFNLLNVPFENYTKELNTALIKAKESISQSIANENTFCNTCIEITKKISITYMKENDMMEELSFVRTTEDFTVYPLAEDINKWLEKSIKSITEIKPLNQRAIDNMKKQGITPKKQAGELLLFLVVPSKTEIHIGIYAPMSYFSIDNFMKDALKNITFDIRIDNNYGFVNYKNDSPLKEKDNTIRYIFNQLKTSGIYVDNTVDEEILTFDNIII
jgi:hypothetical protein